MTRLQAIQIWYKYDICNSWASVSSLGLLLSCPQCYPSCVAISSSSKNIIPIPKLFLGTLDFRSFTKEYLTWGKICTNYMTMCLKILLAWKTKVDDLNSVCEGHEGHVLPRKDEVFDDSQLSVNKWLSLRHSQMGTSCLPIAIEILTHHEDCPSAKPSVLD